jgi:hypothetical protein
MLHPSAVCSLKSAKLKRANPKSDVYGRMQRHCIGHQRTALNVPRSLLAATVGSRHLHLSTLTLHHAAARTFLPRHLCVRGHARHSRGHTGHQQQQNRSELAQKLHLTEEYAAPRDATTGTTNIRLLVQLPGIRVLQVSNRYLVKLGQVDLHSPHQIAIILLSAVGCGEVFALQQCQDAAADVVSHGTYLFQRSSFRIG